MAEQVKRPWGYRHVILLLLWLLYIINYFDRISVLTFLPYIQKDLSLSPVEVGWLASIFFFGYAIAQVIAGFLADKIGPKRTMNIAIWVFTFVTFLTGFVKTFWQFIWLRLGLALGEGQHFAPSLRMIADWFPRDEKARANGFISSTAAVAPALVPIIVTQLAAGFDGWRPVFFVLAVPGFVGIWLLWRYVADNPKQLLNGRVTEEEYQLITSSPDATSTDQAKSFDTKMFLTDVHFYLYCAGLFIMLMMYWGMSAWISTFLVKQHGMDIKTMGFVASVPYIVAFISMNFGGWMADTWFKAKPKYVTIISFIGCIPTFYLIGHVAKGNIPMLLFGLMMGGFFIHLCFGMMYSFPARRYPKEVVGRAVGVSNAVGQMGSFTSPLVAGYLVLTNADNTYDFSNVFLFWSSLAIVGVAAIWFLKEEFILDTDRFKAKAAAGVE